jgi:hypothetical protein
MNVVGMGTLSIVEFSEQWLNTSAAEGVLCGETDLM